MLINDRIRLIMKVNELNASAFADIIDVNKSSISHVLSGRNRPSLDFLEKIISHFPNVNASWLITGETREGEFIPDEALVTTSANKKEIEYIAVFYSDGTFRRYQSGEDSLLKK